MTFLLDTCVLSELVRKRPRASVLAWMEGQEEHRLHLSVLTLGELRKGAAKLDGGDPRVGALEEWIAHALPGRFGRRLLAVDEAVASFWGKLVGSAERRGHPLPVIDSLLAATAAVHGLTVVTRNVEDLERCGARVLNPWDSP